MKCDELEEMVLEDGIGQMWKCYDVEEVNEAIAELKQFAEDACLERDDNQTAIDELQAENAELKAEIESLKASHYAEMVDAGMRERRLRRALLLMCARLGKMGSLAYHNIKAKLFFFDDIDGVKWALRKREQWKNVERKCRAKAEEYK